MTILAEVRILDNPRKYVTEDWGLTFTGYFRAFPADEPIRYFYYPYRRQLLIDATDGLWWAFHRFHVERISRNRFRLTPIPHNFIVETHLEIPIS